MTISFFLEGGGKLKSLKKSKKIYLYKFIIICKFIYLYFYTNEDLK